MRKRWRVVAVGKGWDYRDSHAREFVTRNGARRYAKAMNAMPGGAIPLTCVVESIEATL